MKKLLILSMLAVAPAMFGAEKEIPIIDGFNCYGLQEQSLLKSRATQTDLIKSVNALIERVDALEEAHCSFGGIGPVRIEQLKEGNS